MTYKPMDITAVGILMIEHRQIERVIEVIKTELEITSKDGRAKPEFIDIAIDFIRTYADKSHHGKEEQIFFRDLYKKKLTKEHKEYIDMLIDEHKKGRETVAKLEGAKKKYLEGNSDALGEIKECMKWLIDFYPQHIEKEDKHFFALYRNYLNEKEQNSMLAECLEFDASGIHEKYKDIIERLKKVK